MIKLDSNGFRFSLGESMAGKITWVAAIILPFLASCGMQMGLVKKGPDLSPTPDKKIAVAKADTQKAPLQGAFHIVGPGETLKRICDVYGLDLKKVARINKLKTPYTMRSGDTVFLPAGALLPDTKVRLVSTTTCSGKNAFMRVTCHTIAKAISGKRDPRVPELKFPVPGGVLTSPFGYRWGRLHTGLDIAAPVGTPVLACADGRVIFTGSRKRFRRYGNTVLIDHGHGVYTYYAHLSRIWVKKNEKVRRGQKIADVGNTGRTTGPHLHLEVRVNRMVYNPLAYLCPHEVAGTLMAKHFFERAPMGPVRSGWRVPDLLAARR
jgi:murein DD-endopeptidase MepM/ murein hydrolase activator NlpD